MLNRFLKAAFVVAFLIPGGAAVHGDTDPASVARENFQSGLAYERLGRLDEAYTNLQVASNLAPDDVQIALALGVVAVRLGRFDEAVRSLEHSIALDANSCASYYELALLYEKKGLNDRALDSWQRFLALTPDSLLKREAQKHIDYLGSPRG